MSAIPFLLSGSVLSVYLRVRGATGELFDWMAASWILWRIVVLWVVPLEFLARKRGIILAIQGAVVATVAGVALLCSVGGPPLTIVAMAWILALLSATHGAVVDGLFVSELGERSQIKHVFVIPIFWNLCRFILSGGLVGAVGLYGDGFWGIGLAITTGVLSLVWFWQSRSLPDPDPDRYDSSVSLLSNSLSVVRELSRKPMVVPMLTVGVLVTLPATVTSSAIADFVFSFEGPNRHTMSSWIGLTATPAFVASLAGILWVLRNGLEKTFSRAVMLTNTTVLLAFVASLLGPEVNRDVVLVLLALASFPLQFLGYVSTLYVVQQLAPGRYCMSAHALAVLAIWVSARPVAHFAVLLQERLGFPVLFAFLAVLSAGAVIASKYAPFERKYRLESGVE